MPGNADVNPVAAVRRRQATFAVAQPPLSLANCIDDLGQLAITGMATRGLFRAIGLASRYFLSFARYLPGASVRASLQPSQQMNTD